MGRCEQRPLLALFVVGFGSERGTKINGDVGRFRRGKQVGQLCGTDSTRGKFGRSAEAGSDYQARQLAAAFLAGGRIRAATSFRVKLTGQDGETNHGSKRNRDLLHGRNAGDGNGRHEDRHRCQRQRRRNVRRQRRSRFRRHLAGHLRAQQNGQTIANKQLSLNATGGM